MKLLIDHIRQLQQKYDLSKELIQEVTQRETLKGLNLRELEEVVILLNDYCLNLKLNQPNPIEETKANLDAEVLTDSATQGNGEELRTQHEQEIAESAIREKNQKPKKGHKSNKITF
jgi:hypothetical protein